MVIAHVKDGKPFVGAMGSNLYTHMRQVDSPELTFPTFTRGSVGSNKQRDTNKAEWDTF